MLALVTAIKSQRKKGIAFKQTKITVHCSQSELQGADEAQCCSCNRLWSKCSVMCASQPGLHLSSHFPTAEAPQPLVHDSEHH